MAALAGGRTRIDNFSTSEDCAATLSCLKKLGVNIEIHGAHVEIEGVGLDGLRAPTEPLDCRNSGSTMRMLAGVLASQDFVSELTGDESLRTRPMRRIIEPLTMMGARIESTDGHAPLRITGRSPLNQISYALPVASAQVKACVLLAGLNTTGRTEVIESSSSTRDHTERLLRWFGVQVSQGKAQSIGAGLGSVSVTGPVRLVAHNGTIPGDISSAAFFIAAAALLPHSDLELNEVGLNPTRRGIIRMLLGLEANVRLEVMETRGVITDFKEERGHILRIDPWDMGCVEPDFNEEQGSVFINGGVGLAPLEAGRSNILSGALIPQLIDELPMIAVLGTQVFGGLTIRDAAELRVKETDRIAATVKNLRAMGAQVEEHDDGLTIKERTTLHGARLNSYGDHRIAMAFSIAALIATGESEIVGAECVKVSFPEFYELLESVVER